MTESSDDEIYLGEITKSMGLYLLIIMQSIYVLILSPISLYFAYKFHKLSQRNIPFFTKRHPKLVLFCVLLYNLYPLIIRPISDFIWILHLSGYVYIPPHAHFLPFFIPMTIHALAYLNVTRIWILYFDYNRCLQSLSKAWKTQITQKQNYKPWTLRYTQVGSIKILLVSWTLFSIFLMSFLGIVMVLLDTHPLLKYIQIVGILPPISLVIMIYNIRKARDQFALKREFIWLFCANVCVVLLYGGFIVPFFQLTSVSRIIAINIVTNIGCYALCYISTWWVIAKYYIQKKSFKEEYKQTVENREHKNMSLEDILCTKDGFDLFADHLVREFCIESLLFLFEMMQIKSQLVNKNLLDDGEVGTMVKMTSQRMQRTRHCGSALITSIYTLKTNLKHIIDQYIAVNSDYSINISSRTRQKLLSFFAKVKVEVFHVPKYDWIRPSNLYESTSKHISQQWDNRSYDLSVAGAQITKDNISVPRMNAIDDLEIEPRALTEVPTLDWIDSTGQNTLEIERNEKDSKLMIEYLQAFDKALSEILSLLNGDTLLRFYSTNDYQRVLKQFMCLMITDRKQSE